jgi:hypothetical protein
MFKKLTIIVFFLVSFVGFSQNNLPKLKEYSFTELFKMIEEEQDTIFELSNAVILIDSLIDKRFFQSGPYSDRLKNIKDTLVINKALKFDNVIFDAYASFLAIHFKKDVNFNNSGPYEFYDCTFDGKFISKITHKLIDNYTGELKRNKDLDWYVIHGSTFNNVVKVNNIYNNVRSLVQFSCTQNNFFTNKIPFENNKTTKLYLSFNHVSQLNFSENIVESGKHKIAIVYSTGNAFFFKENDISGRGPFILKILGQKILHLRGNKIENPLLLSIDKIHDDNNISWSDFGSKVMNQQTYLYSFFEQEKDSLETQYPYYSVESVNAYLNKHRHDNEFVFNNEIMLRGKFMNHYKTIYNLNEVDKIYIEIKDIETKRFEFIYKQKPVFKNYFKWKMNVFLKVFSDYGTNSSKSIIFSFYVILFFAGIYIFFPNTWNENHKNKITDRYAFFIKYLNKKAGIHEVYMEDKKDELIDFHEFKNYVEDKGKTVPKFFSATALPIYKWLIFGTNFTAIVLSKFDVLKGTWKEEPKSKRKWKSVLIIFAFLIVILYDICIKIFNELMLSINTFTTLGFGEIPIKGLPRYLAIIEGFIGWFMLTIFSVSLISQLLVNST